MRLEGKRCIWVKNFGILYGVRILEEVVEEGGG
jgi:hypothetical protein